MKGRKSRRGTDYHFDKAAADRACEFFEIFLHHIKGEWAGEAFVLEKWQWKEIIRPLFGWKGPDGLRRYRMTYIEVPKKNGKSTLAAGIALYLLMADDEPGAEVFSVAADRDQAAIVFDSAKSMVLASPELAQRCDVYKRAIVFRQMGSSYRVLSADAPTKHGLNPSGVIFDELHAQRTRELWDTLVGGVGARRQPLVVAITTAGYDRKSICYEQHEYALKVRDGILRDDSFLPVIYAADKDDEWSSPKIWKKANPGLGISVKKRFLEEECARAKESPAKQNTFRRLHLNQWTEQATRWIDMTVWTENGGPVDAESLKGRECFAGLDLSSSQDVSALVLLFPPAEEDQIYRVLPFFWIPEENIQARVRRDRVPYDAWVREGYVMATEGNVIDQGFIRAKINELSQIYNIREIAYDRWGTQKISTELQEDGMTIVPFGQGFGSMAGPSRQLEELLLGRKVAHANNPVLTWMASNVAVRQDPAGNIKPDKSKSADRIDGIVALVMAVGRAAVHIDVTPGVWVIG